MIEKTFQQMLMSRLYLHEDSPLYIRIYQTNSAEIGFVCIDSGWQTNIMKWGVDESAN